MAFDPSVGVKMTNSTSIFPHFNIDVPTPQPPIVARMLPMEKRAAFLSVREALFGTGRLTGDEADVWAWRVAMAVGEPAHAIARPRSSDLEHG